MANPIPDISALLEAFDIPKDCRNATVYDTNMQRIAAGYRGLHDNKSAVCDQVALDLGIKSPIPAQVVNALLQIDAATRSIAHALGLDFDKMREAYLDSERTMLYVGTKSAALAEAKALARHHDIAVDTVTVMKGVYRFVSACDQHIGKNNDGGLLPKDAIVVPLSYKPYKG